MLSNEFKLIPVRQEVCDSLYMIPVSRSSLRREADACVSTRLTGANQAPIVARGVSRSFRAHHIDAALGLESDGMLRSRARY